MTPALVVIAWVIVLVASILGLVIREPRGWYLFGVTLAVSLVMLILFMVNRGL